MQKMEKAYLKVVGMYCTSCKAIVEKLKFIWYSLEVKIVRSQKNEKNNDEYNTCTARTEPSFLEDDSMFFRLG